MKIRTATFQSSAPDLASCPTSGRQEFAFIGRSNVGKSSIINMLTGQSDLAKVSGTPGKTKLINFFTINDSWSLVDLPGYGYAKVARKDRSIFSAFVADYLQNRPNLVGTFVLIDSRLSPQKIDLEFLHWMVGCGLPFVLLFTKTDKLSEAKVQQSIETFMAQMRDVSEDEPVFLTSSSKLSQGRTEILGLIADALAEDSREANESEPIA